MAIGLYRCRQFTISQLLLIAVCGVLFLFTFHAKTGVYDHLLRSAPDASTADKLWADSETPRELIPVLFVLWFLAALLRALPKLSLHGDVRECEEPALSLWQSRQLSRFLRPPPVR